MWSLGFRVYGGPGNSRSTQTSRARQGVVHYLVLNEVCKVPAKEAADVPPMMLVAVTDVSPFLPLPEGIRLHFVLYAAFWRTCACLEKPTSAASLPQNKIALACLDLPKACTP